MYDILPKVDIFHVGSHQKADYVVLLNSCYLLQLMCACRLF
jgi:hypothetical protein